MVLMHHAGTSGRVGSGGKAGVGVIVGAAGTGVSVSVGGGAVWVAVGVTVQVQVDVDVAVRVKVGVGGGVLVRVGGGGNVGGGAVGTVCALAEPTQPGALPAAIPIATTTPAATRMRRDRRILPWNMLSSFTVPEPIAQGPDRAFLWRRQRSRRLTGRGIQPTMPTR